MLRLRPIIPLLTLLALLPASILISWTVNAQDRTPPVPIQPGQSLITVTPTFPPDECYKPLPIVIGQEIFIEPGVNIRNAPTQSAALVWNTIYNSYDEDGDVVEPQISPAAIVVEGPVCAEGYNWWRITGLENNGWVAEGRPDQGGYFLIVPGFSPGTTCSPRPDLLPGIPAELLLNTRVRELPDPASRTKTIAPAGSAVDIIGGPECVGTTLWWLVRVTVVDFTYEGWMAEGEDDLIWLVPRDRPSLEDGTLCADPRPFFVGMRGLVSYGEGPPKNLRIGPGEIYPILFDLVRNVPFVIEGGPVCSGNLNWWKIRVLASQPVVGWMAEGSPGVGYWMRELDPDEYAR